MLCAVCILLGKSSQNGDDEAYSELKGASAVADANAPSSGGDPGTDSAVDLERQQRDLKRLQQELKIREGRPDFYLPVLLPMHRVGHMMQRKKLWGGTDDILLHWLEEEYGKGTGVFRLLKELRKNRYATKG